MKKIHVDWNDLKPGDLIHVKGSTNTYKFVSYGSETVLGDPGKNHLQESQAIRLR